MRKLMALVLLSGLVTGCGMGYVASEMTGSAKPEGGIKEVIQDTKSYSADNMTVWKACLAVLDDQGYTYSADSASGRIKSDPKVLGDPNKVAIAGATYSAIVIVKVENSSVNYKARFNKKSNIVQDSESREYPEKENELRRDFFAALDKKIKG